ncbi:BREX-1 system phosphatase PglZ type A [Carboxylicivirga sp. N1Y90]|uniref:BREX-1 system phosphatase PglZ type A n=1 Tax=Carboxylicivirga fragile TaxID=3417571 RepID=UPI003D32759D|nr:BREX-1 system phosphatase PglZ type A [Marinilabiliaceae bacterium N1Y90]
MIVDKIKNILLQEKRNIVFYFDADGSLRDDLQEIEASGIKVIEVQNNYFELKYRLEIEWAGQQLFLYHPFARPNDNELKKYPLLDLLKANAELRLDDASEFLSEYGLQDHHLSLVKRYIKQLKTKTNQKKLAKILDKGNFNASNLKLGLISISLNFSSITDRNSCIAKLLIKGTDATKFNKLLKTIKEQDIEADILEWISNLVNKRYSELNIETVSDVARLIKYNILTVFIDKTIKADSYSKLKMDNAAGLNRMQSFFQDWENNPTLKGHIETVFSDLAADIQYAKIIEWYGTEQEYGYYSEDMLNRLILDLYHNIENHPVRTKDECIKWMRSSTLPDDLVEQVNFIYNASGMYGVLESYKSFKFNAPEDYVNEYSNELYQVDLSYRKAVIAYENASDDLYDFEQVASKVFSTLNEKYDRFLIDLNVEWQKIMAENKFNYHALDVNKQFDFYDNNIKDFNNKIVVIISDALRYELGHDMYNDMLSNSKNDLTIEPCLASIPSYTNLGMANLLPNTDMVVEKADADLSFKVNGKTTVSTNRESILQTQEKESATINFSELKRMSKQEKRAFFRDQRITYVYHDWIDAVGDKKKTEHESFEATEKAIKDLKWLINNISGEIRIMHVLVTSDHGFLYNYNELAESSREVLPKTKGYSREHARFVIADEFEGKVDGYQMDLKNTTNLDTDLKVSVPRAINRYRKQGNVGVQFAHGGASLQELVTPVIKLYKNRKEANQAVSFKRIDQADKISSGSLKITILQDQPVSNEYKSSEVVFGLFSDTGELLSNDSTLILNSTSNNPKERVFEVILSLNTLGSKASFGYLRAYDKKDKSRLNPIGVNDLIKISTREIDEW